MVRLALKYYVIFLLVYLASCGIAWSQGRQFNPVPHKWINGFAPQGQPLIQQPSFGDLSDAPTLPFNCPASQWIVSVTSPLGFACSQPQVSDLGDTGWTSWTPTVTCSGGGSFTTTSANGRYKLIGKTVLFQMAVKITAHGTCAGYVQASLPPGVNLPRDISSGMSISPAVMTGTGRETQSTGLMVEVIYQGGFGSNFALLFYNNAATGNTDNYQFIITGSYETT